MNSIITQGQYRKNMKMYDVDNLNISILSIELKKIKFIYKPYGNIKTYRRKF